MNYHFKVNLVQLKIPNENYECLNTTGIVFVFFVVKNLFYIFAIKRRKEHLTRIVHKKNNQSQNSYKRVLTLH